MLSRRELIRAAGVVAGAAAVAPLGRSRKTRRPTRPPPAAGAFKS